MTPETVKITALCSVPRLGFNDHFGAMIDTLSRVGIPYRFTQGAFWEKCLENAIDTVINTVDIIIVVDYDTLATPQHLRRMFDTMNANPHIDALAPNQPRRGTGMPLWTILGTEGETQISCDGPTKVTTAHFGFTMIRTKALKDMPKPWFPRVYAADGACEGEGSRDPDIEFWMRWAAKGKTLYVEPSVCIGHLETMVSYFDQVERPSINEQIEMKRAELDALQNRATADPNEKVLELSQVFISTTKWREKFGGAKGMASLGESETR